MKRLIPVVAVILVLLWVGRVLARNYEAGLLEAPDKWPTKGAVLVQIKDGAGAGAVTADLAQKGVIRSEWAFRRMLRRKGWDSKLKPGLYKIDEGSSSEAIGKKLAEHSAWRIKVTLPEGLTVQQIAQRIERAGHEAGAQYLPTAAEVVRAATAAALAKSTGLKAPAATAEGYLFPATYQFEAGASADDIVAELTGQFKKTFVSPNRDEIIRSKLSLHELVTLASIVEREAASDPERPKIAQVFLNRIAQGMRLQSCATVQYALPKHKSRLLYEDLRIDSPYNTYIHKGLPPGPICSPGKASLMAALRPEPTDALYFVAKGDGTHIFSRTFAEHQGAIAGLGR